ncbi:MAG: phosphoenolpyruvate synthase [Bacteroidales bacterium]|nr:phosphoenolpyruvate synthase [Bacteroidales bacterium]
MQRRIQRVLIVCSEYDTFTLEVDGRIEEQIFNEYVSLNLSNPPRFKHVNTAEKALKEIHKSYYDLIITMLNVGEKFDAFGFAKEIKKKHPNKPVVVLTPFSREVSLLLENEDLSAIDYVFSWLGSVDVILAIIKLLEDKMNIEKDIKSGVQVILLVEDSVRYYSGYLTNMYKTLLVQSKKFMTEGLNEHQQMIRMRGRPKILLAKNYEEANILYKKYKSNILGVISDTKYPRNGKIDPKAGVKFLKKIKSDKIYMPLLLQSSDIKNSEKAKEIKVGFIHKYSENLAAELINFMNTYFAFGAFEFKNPKTKEVIKRTLNLKELQYSIFDIPDDSFEYHISRNHLSKWLYARALFPIAELFAGLSKQDFADDINKIKKFIYENISNYRQSSSRGVIAEFNRNNYDNSLIFSRIGKGYLGGKARGLAFLDKLIKQHSELDNYENIIIKIPQTVVLSTEIFDNFMLDNDLYAFALSKKSNEEILDKFINANLRDDTKDDLRVFLEAVEFPIAVRSSSVLEDSHYQPFAGVFATYMLSNSADSETNLSQLLTAVKSVYASVFYKETKAYMKATKNLIDEEKMGIVLQEVCGNRYENRFYPTISGVARSVNFYPVGDEKTEEGIVNVALGLGKQIVEGKRTLRFSPELPKKVLQLSSPETALKETQKTFFSLNLTPESFVPSTNDSINFEVHRIKQAEKDESIYDISSVYDFEFNVLKVGKMYEGKRLITFANVLKYDSFPLANIIKDVLRICQQAMNNPVEIEFAANLTPDNGQLKQFNLLQIRPIVEEVLNDEIDFSDIKKEDSVIFSETSLGHGIIKGIKDIVYVKPESFDSVNNKKIVDIIAKINSGFTENDSNYILCGPGRWGSSDPWLGIPVVWSQISAARLIIESGLENYQIEPSQGTHFFQNLTSFKIGYFTINPFRNDGFWNLEYLDQFDAVYEDEFVRHVRFDKDLIIKIDGKQSKGVVLKPE